APELRQFLSTAALLKQIAKDRVLGALAGGALATAAGGPVLGAIGATVGATIGAHRYFKALPEIREAIPRAAAFRYNVSRQARGLPMRTGGVDVSGLEGARAAAKVARELTVDYGRFTEFENRILRGLLLPFYSWAKTNTVNWLRFLTSSLVGLLAFFGTRLLLELC